MGTTVERAAEVENRCRQAYIETREIWDNFTGNPEFVTHHLGFRILESPPCLRPDLLILSTNSGMDDTDPPNERDEWPDRCLYNAANESDFYEGEERLRQYGRPHRWLICRRLRDLFGDTHRQYLASSVPLHMLFFKSSGIGRAQNGMGWKDNSLQIRRALERHSRDWTLQLIEMMEPRAILTLGFNPFDKLSKTDWQPLLLKEPDDQCIVKSKVFNGIPVLGIIHPTGGVGITNNDRQRMGVCLRNFLDEECAPRVATD